MRNFPKLQLSIFFLQFSKKKYSYLWGGFCGGNFEIYHANQQFSTCMYVDWHTRKQTRKIHDQSSTRLRMLLYNVYAHEYKLKIHKVLLKVKTSHLWEYLKSYKSIKRTAQLKTFKLTLQQLIVQIKNIKQCSMESGNKYPQTNIGL